MKRGILPGEQTSVASRRSFSHRRNHFVKLRECRIVDAKRCRTGGHALERSTNWIDLEKVVRLYLANLRASERRTDHKAVQLEVTQRFADRRLTDAELRGQTRFDNSLARRQLTAQDVVDQPLANLL